MTRRILFEEAAETDFREATAYIFADRPSAADRFVEAAIEAVDLLAATPEIGRVYETDHPKLQQLRRWPIRDFPYQIFYRVTAHQLLIVRLLHGARDLPRALQDF